MSRFTTHCLRILATVLALAAMAILLGLAMHGHHDDCHGYCWVCHSSLGKIGLPAVAFIIVVVWSARILPLDTILALNDPDANLHSAPRAPPC